MTLPHPRDIILIKNRIGIPIASIQANRKQDLFFGEGSNYSPDVYG